MVNVPTDRISKIAIFLALGILGFLTLPFAFLFLRIEALSVPDHAELIWALKNSVIQAFGSACLSLGLGFIFFMGLVQIRSKLGASIFRWAEILCLVPGMLPSIFTILIALCVINPFPMGLRGIVLIHALLYGGFIAASLYQIVQDKALSLIEVAYVLGASRFRILGQIMGLLKWDLFSLGLLIFSICFTSFAIPMTVGGGWGTTLEVLIYEKIHISSDWAQALSLAFIQSLVLFGFSFFQRRGNSLHRGRYSQIPVLGNWTSFFLTLVFVVGYPCTFLFFSVRGWTHWTEITQLFASSWELWPQSLLTGFGCGILVYLLLNVVAFCWSQSWLRRFLLGYIAPSTSLAGILVVAYRPNAFWLQLIFYIFAFVTIVLSGLYRMGFDQKLASLRSQVEVARTLGANSWLIYVEVLFPQVHSLAARLGGIAALWMVGDFALSRVIFSNDVVVAQMVRGLVNSYQFDLGMALMSVLIFMGIGVYFLFERFGRVIGYQAS